MEIQTNKQTTKQTNKQKINELMDGWAWLKQQQQQQQQQITG